MAPVPDRSQWETRTAKNWNSCTPDESMAVAPTPHAPRKNRNPPLPSSSRAHRWKCRSFAPFGQIDLLFRIQYRLIIEIEIGCSLAI